MSENNNHDKAMSALERSLGSLRPRRDRLDPRWRDALATEAALMESLQARTEGNTHDGSEDADLQNLPPCESPAGHRMVCVRCGVIGSTGSNAASVARRATPRAWQAAFATMTALAAILLVMLWTRPESPIGEQSVATPTGSVAEGSHSAALMLSDLLVAPSAPYQRKSGRLGNTSSQTLDPLAEGLRIQTLMAGDADLPSDFWTGSQVVEAENRPRDNVRTGGEPLKNRQLLDRMLNQRNADGDWL